MVISLVFLFCCFSPGVAFAKTFGDVLPGSWYEDDVGLVSDMGFMTGYGGEDDFGPDDPLTRGQAAVVILRLSGDDPPFCASEPFEDVVQDRYYTSAVNWAHQNRYIAGYGGTCRFGPDDPLTREQLVVILRRYLAGLGVDGDGSALSPFADHEKVSSWARDSLNWAVANDILEGSCGMLMPQAAVTRAQMAKIIYRSWLLTQGHAFVPDYREVHVDDYSPRTVERYELTDCYHVLCSHCGYGAYIPWEYMLDDPIQRTHPADYARYQDVLGHVEAGDCLTTEERQCRDYSMIHTVDERTDHEVLVGTTVENVKVGSHIELIKEGGYWK